MDSVKANVQSEVFNIVVGETAKINKYVLFGLNTSFLLPFVIRNYSVQGLVTFLVATLLMFIVAIKSSGKSPAIVNLPVMLLADVLTYVGIHFLELKSMINMEGLSSYFSDVTATFWIVFLAGLVVGLAGIANKKTAWITGLAGGLIGASVILVGWSNCDINNLRFADSGAALLLLFAAFDIIWTIILYFIVKTAPEKVTGVIWIGVALLCVFLAGLTIETEYIKECLPAWKAGLLECPYTIFAWWKVILSSIVILVGIFILYVIDGDAGNHLSVDTYVLIVLGEIILTTKILMSNYFSFNGLILIGLIIGTLSCMKNDYLGKKTLKLDSIVYLLVQYFAVLLSIFLLRRGLWINVIVSVAFFIAFYVEHNKPQKAGSNTAHWIMILLCIVSETLALAWRHHFSIDLVIVLALVLCASILTILVINIKQPGNRTAPNIFRIIVCICVAAICLTATSRNSVIIDHIDDDDNQKVTVTIEPKGKNISIASAYYYWRDITGKVLAEDINIPRSECAITKESEILTIVVEDDQGFFSSKIIWYPYWLRSVLE